MALAHHPDRTLIIQVGRTRVLSDLAGRYIKQLDDSAESRRAVARGLETAGCSVRLDGDWRTAGDFTRATRAAGPDPPPSLDGHV